jgi:hypothetical protein
MVTNTRKVVKVFLASPSDLQNERSLAKEMVDEFNDTIGKSLGYHVDLVGWEDTIAGYGRPQSLINKDLEQCEYFIGLMWQRWGSPPDSEVGEFSSGFEEEFELTLRRRGKGAKPEMSLFFKIIAPEFLRDPGPGLTRVLAFRERMETEKRVMFETFGDEREYLRKLRRCIFAYIQRLAAQDAEQKSEQQQERPTSNADAPAKQEQSVDDSFFSNSGMTFLRGFLDRARTNRSEPTPLDVARFRLLADIAQKSGNDEGLLGVHDANLIYLGISPENLGRRELDGLADCGFRHFSTETTPLWKWIASIKNANFTSFSTWIGPNDQRQGALLAMSLTHEALWVDSDFKRSEYLNNWFAPDTHNSIKAAALIYLGAAGLPEDLEWVDREIKRNDFHTRTAAVRAAIRIGLSEGQSKAIQAIIELQPSDLDDELIGEIFDNGTSIDPDQLNLLIQSRSQKVRAAALRFAKHKSILTIEIANRLLSDTDADIRYEALNYLIQAGQAFPEAEAKAALVKPSPGILYSGDANGERVFEQYQVKQLSVLTADQLNEKVHSSSVYFFAPYLARAEGHFGSQAKILRSDIDDQFKSYFEERISRLEAMLGPGEVDKTKELSEFIRKGMTRKSLDILCKKMIADDLDLVRRVLEHEFVEYSAADVAYLVRYGSWDDIPLLISMTKRPAYRGASLMLFSSDDMYLTVARAILRLGRGRLEELLELEISSSLKNLLIVNAPNTGFAKVSTELVSKLLRSEDVALRKSTCLKCLVVFKQARVRKIFNTYIGGDQFHYYNVIHWLDFGISMPPHIVAPAVKRTMRSRKDSIW